MDHNCPRTVLRFGVFEADLRAGELRRSGTRIRLQEQPFRVLTVLLSRPGELVTREELRREVWPDNTFVEFDQALNTAVKKIRIALCDDAATPRYVETIPKRGYRFIASVTPDANSKLEGPAARSASSLAFWKLIAASTIAVALIAFAGFRLSHRRVSPSRKAVRLAVLPFENWSDDPSGPHICDAITRELIARLSGSPPARFELVPETATMQYRHTAKTIAQVAAELHADYLLQGSLRTSDQRLRVTAELIRVSGGIRAWRTIIDHDATNSQVLEDDLAQAIAAAVTPTLLQEAQNPAPPMKGPAH